MERKLVKMGEYSVMAAIPMPWIKKNHLKPGNKVNFSEVDNKLVLSTETEVFKKKIEVHLSSPRVEIVWRVLQPIYTSGYEEAEITFDDAKALKELEFGVRHLIGFEIVEVKKNKVIIKSVVSDSDEEFERILRRTFLTLIHISEVLTSSFAKKKTDGLWAIKDLEWTVNKYTMFLKRLINRKGYKYPHYMYSLVTFLELTSNHFEYLRRYFYHNTGIKIGKNVVSDSKKINDLINRIYDLHYNYSEKKFEKIAFELPHFTWFDKIKDSEIKYNFKSIAGYLVQISRLVKANNL